MVVNEVSPRGLKHHCTLKKPKLTYVVAITQVPLPEVLQVHHTVTPICNASSVVHASERSLS